jgi:mannitol/fructose-specific phosphotransferase system IIA component (Ntr-type)
LRILKRLSQLLENPQFHTDLQSQKNPQGAFSVICKYEDLLLSMD